MIYVIQQLHWKLDLASLLLTGLADFYIEEHVNPIVIIYAAFCIAAADLIFALAKTIIVDERFNKVIANILVPQFIEKRPLREVDQFKRDAKMNEILAEVNFKLEKRLKTNYVFQNTMQMVDKYNTLISEFDERYQRYYKKEPIEAIKGFDKMMCIARNITEEDVNFQYSNMFSSETYQEYLRRPNVVNEEPINDRRTTEGRRPT
ncbi:uncharacterized protein PRCAT00004761001 [Priceomyces carsonii]|uniref:uncharacterized protein n=1 Tax=Priceomyces carsonii TaxID=28549 RepID=UPI002ED92A75|nr:unnamed protein product [Priceomyces carsonii]